MAFRESFIVDTPEQLDSLQQPLITLHRGCQYRRDTPVNHSAVHVRGVHELQTARRRSFLEDGNGGLRVQSRELAEFDTRRNHSSGRFAPKLKITSRFWEDAVLQRTGRPFCGRSSHSTTIGRNFKRLHTGFVS